MQDVYKIIDEYSVCKERKVLIVFDDMTDNKNLSFITNK